jgi:hypothetical protein
MAIRDTSFGNQLGQALGTGIANLAHHKLGEIKTKRLNEMFQKGGFNPETSNILSHFAQHSPKELPKILEMLAAGRQQEQQETEDGQQDNSFAGDLRRGTDKQKSVMPPEKRVKYYSELQRQRNNLVDVMKIAGNIQGKLEEPDIQNGLYANIISNISPNWLNKSTESLDKDASKLIELSAQAVKGPASKYRIATIEKGKIGVKHSKEVNQEISKEAYNNAKLKLAELDATYPELKDIIQKSLTPSVAKIVIENEAPSPKDFPEDTVWESDSGYQFEIKNGKWSPLKNRVNVEGDQNG